jgi:regulator of protease activity HflC (stomatin/prohibitin superfamily)
MKKSNRKKIIWAAVAVVVFVPIAIYIITTVFANHQVYVNVPAGYIGMLLTPGGWDARILEAGQVDIGPVGDGGIGNRLVLLEITSTAITEKFMEATATEDKADHRVLTKDGVPLSAGVVVRVTLPDTEPLHNSIFTQVTPAEVAGQPGRVLQITLEQVYKRFAMDDVRAVIRGIFAQYDNYKDVYAKIDEVNQKIRAAVSRVFEDNQVPLILQNAAISNAKPDQKVWDAENEKVAAQSRADAMKIISEAIKDDPNSLTTLKWQSLQKIAEVSAASGTKIIIITDAQAVGLDAAALSASLENK